MEDLDPILQQIIYGSPGQLTSPTPPSPPTAYQLMLELAEEINENVESKDKKDDYWQDIKDVKSVNTADTVTDTDQNQNTFYAPYQVLQSRHPTKEDIRGVLSRKWKHNLLILYPIVEIFKYKTSEQFPTNLNIATTSKILNNIYKSVDRTAFAIDLAKKVDLLREYSPKYHFGDRRAYCRGYIWNKSTEKLLLSMFEENDIEWQFRQLTEHKKKKAKKIFRNGFTKSEFRKLEKKIRIGVNLQIKLNKKVTTELVESIVYEKYPAVLECKKLAEEVNQYLPLGFQIKTELNFHKSKKTNKITGIGFRPTTPYVSFKKNKDENSEYTGIYRQDFLDNYFGVGNWIEHDRKSSVPSVTKTINNNCEYHTSQEDLYNTMFNIENKQDFKINDRKILKKIFMRFNFDGSPARIKSRLVAQKLIPTFLSKYGEKKLDQTINLYLDRINQTIGKSYNSEIFVYEGLVYLYVYRELVLASLRQHKTLPLIIYDAFYYDKTLDVDMEELMYQAWSKAKKFIQYDAQSIYNGQSINQSNNHKIKQAKANNRHKDILSVSLCRGLEKNHGDPRMNTRLSSDFINEDFTYDKLSDFAVHLARDCTLRDYIILNL